MKKNVFQLEKKIIFVVDDVETTLIMAKNALKKDFRVITLGSAGKLFAFLEKIKPNLILLDIEMPEMNGFQALKKIKENKRNKDIPVVFLASGGTIANVAKAASFGACDFVVKPFEPNGLLEKVKKNI